MWLRHIYRPNDYLSLLEFSYLKVADIVQYTDSTEGAHKVEVLYGIPKDTGAPFLEALGSW